MKSAVSYNANSASSSSSVCTALLSCEIGMCRICMEESDNKRLLRPCQCKGTQAFVHKKCLETWLKHKNDKICETCNNEYQLKYIGLRKFSEWTLPRPLGDNWEDHADFVCGFVWTLIFCRILYYWLRYGLSDLQEELLNMYGSNQMVSFWWVAFVINTVYYGSIITEVIENWIETNSKYEWKCFSSSSSTDLNNDDLISCSLAPNF